jgi:hypothetical protein
MLASGKEAPGGTDYERRRPEQTLLYQLVEKYYPAVVAQLGEEGKCLPDHVRREFEEYLDALMPKPRVNLIRFHGVFVGVPHHPKSKYRARVTLTKRGKRIRAGTSDAAEDRTPAERRAAMTWAKRLKRVFNIDIGVCGLCGGAVRIIGCIEDPVVIEKILTHLEGKVASAEAYRLPACRVPPQVGPFD